MGGSCSHNSGGPLTFDGTLVGVVFGVSGCGKKHYPTIFTKISFYVDWIRITIE